MAITSDFVTINACDDATQWTAGGQAGTPTNDTTTKKEGTGSVNLGKTGTVAVDFYYDYSFTAINLTDKSWFVWVFIDNQATLDLINVARIYFFDGAGNWRYWDIKNGVACILGLGWNIARHFFNRDWDGQSATAPDITNISQVRIYFETPNATDTITVGSIKMDYWHHGSLITVTGANQTLIEVYDANVANAWGAVDRHRSYWSGTGATWFYSFYFAVRLQVGDGSTTTTMTEGSFLLMFDAHIPIPALAVKDLATVTFTNFKILQVRQYGRVFLSEDGSTVTMKKGHIGRGVDNIGDTDVIFKGTVTLEDMTFRLCSIQGASTTIWSITRLTLDGGSGFVHLFGTDIDDVLIKNCRFGIWNDYNAQISGTTKNLKMRNNVVAFYRGYYHQDYYVINGDIDNWTFSWAGTNAGKTYRQYEFNAHCQDKDGNDLSGVSAVGEYIDPYGEAFSLITDANGDIATQIVDRSWYEQATGSTENMKTPLKVTYSKPGYQTVVKYYDMTEKTKDVVVLHKAVGIFQSFGSPVVNLKKSDPENKNVMVL